ncbi:unnamed protein product [Sympodiomycopsis kandeliae]
MEYSKQASNSEVVKMEARELAKNLVSRDPISFNSALNAYFDSQATYHGHALNIKGVSQIKHAAWLWNILNWGRSSDISAKDINWNQKELTLTINAVRHLRLIFFPIFTLAVPVKSIIHFHPSQEGNSLYATHWEDQWPLGKALEEFPLLGFFVTALFSPVATWLFLTVANLLYAIGNRTKTVSRHYTSPQAQQQYSHSVPVSVKRGFEEGEKIAQGWGQHLLNGATRVSYHPLRLVERSAQVTYGVAAHFVPFALPALSVFDPQIQAETRFAIRGEPIPLRAQKSLSAQEDHSKRTEQDDARNPRGEAQHAETAAYELPAVMSTTSSNKDIKKASVKVGPSNDSEGQVFDVTSHQFNEAKQNPSHGSQPALPHHHEQTLFDKVDQSEVEKAEKAAAKALKKSNKATNADHDHEDDGEHQGSKHKKAKHSSDESGRSSPEKSPSTPKKSTSHKHESSSTKKKRKGHSS